MTTYLFLGERRSPTAIARGWTWEDGRLASATLQRALTAVGLTYGTDYTCANCWDDDGALQTALLDAVRHVQDTVCLVAMGQKVHRLLTHVGLAHATIVHPAARGAIRTRATYQRHVAHTLTQASQDRSAPEGRAPHHTRDPQETT